MESVVGAVRPMTEPKLSQSSAEMMVGHVASIAAAQLPMAEGLRVLAEEAEPPALRNALTSMANAIANGGSIDQALQARLPQSQRFLIGLIEATRQSESFAATLFEALQAIRRSRHRHRRILAAMAYPIVLLIISTFLCLGIVVISDTVIQQFEVMREELFLQNPRKNEVFALASRTVALVAAHASAIALSILIAIVVICLLPWIIGKSLWRQLVYMVPLVGTIEYWSAHADLCRLLSCLVGNSVPLPEALRIASYGLRDKNLARRCHGMSGLIEKGNSFPVAIAKTATVSKLLLPFSANTNPKGFVLDLKSASEMFESMAEDRADSFRTFAPPVIFLLVVLVTCLAMSSIVVFIYSSVQAFIG
jgi:type II secretory pathway component PulF